MRSLSIRYSTTDSGDNYCQAEGETDPVPAHLFADKLRRDAQPSGIIDPEDNPYLGNLAAAQKIGPLRRSGPLTELRYKREGEERAAQGLTLRQHDVASAEVRQLLTAGFKTR